MNIGVNVASADSGSKIRYGLNRCRAGTSCGEKVSVGERKVSYRRGGNVKSSRDVAPEMRNDGAVFSGFRAMEMGGGYAASIHDHKIKRSAGFIDG